MEFQVPEGLVPDRLESGTLFHSITYEPFNPCLSKFLYIVSAEKKGAIPKMSCL